MTAIEQNPDLVHDLTADDFAVLLHLRTPAGEISLLSTLTVFGAPADVTLSELALEAFYPADAVSAERLRVLSAP